MNAIDIEQLKQDIVKTVTRDMTRPVAIHEAGHAVVCKAFGVPIVSANADPSSGAVWRHKTDDEFAAACIAMAGARAAQRSGETSANAMSAKDVQSLTDATRAFLTNPKARPEATAKDFVDTVRETVDEILIDNWAAVHRVAFELMEHREMKGSAVERCIGTVLSGCKRVIYMVGGWG